MLEEVKDFARRRPGTFLLGAAIAGVLAGRATRGGVAAARESSGTSGTGTYAPDTQRAYASSTPVTDAYASTTSGYGTTGGYSTTTGYPETGYPEAVTPTGYAEGATSTGYPETGGATATTTSGYAEDVYTAGSTGTGYAPGTMDPPLETVDVRDETSDAGYATGSGYGREQR